MKLKESETLELKKSTSELKEAAISIASILNKHQKGELYFGIRNNGTVLGQDIGRNTLKDVSKTISENIEPRIFPKVKEISLTKKKCIHVDFSGNNVPYYAYGRAYIRVGDEDRQISAKELERLILEKNKDKLRWDNQVCEGASYDDVDKQAVNWFKKKYAKTSGKKIISSNNELLKSLGCIKESKITNAGILLFGKNPSEFFPRYYICISRYPGKDIGTAYLEIKDIEGNLFEIIDKSEKYIRRHIEIFHILKQGQVAREPIQQYPDFVIRELIVNAVAHRDYSITGSKILIKMFKDRIEFDSPGGFAGNVNEKNILYEQFSRNPFIVKVLNKIGYIEEMGEGWNRIIETIKKYPLKFGKKPKIKGNTRVVVTLFSPAEYPREIGLNQRQRKAVEYIKKYGRITRKKYEEINKISKRTAVRDLTDLIAKKTIKEVGKGPSLYYILLGVE